jgi:hypothetical protein
MTTQVNDLYGSTRLSMAEIRDAATKMTGINFSLHDSAYRGGGYFRAEERAGEEIVIQINTFQFEGESEVAEPDFSEYPVILWVAWTSRGDELRRDLQAIDGLDFLRRNER